MNCKQCNSPLQDKRQDTVYCNHNCQQKYFKRKQQILQRISKVESEITLLNEVIVIKETALSKLQKVNDIELDLEMLCFFSIEKKHKEFQHVLNLNRTEFKKLLFQNILKSKEDSKFSDDAFIVAHYPVEHDSLIDRYLDNYKYGWDKVEEQYHKSQTRIQELETAKARDQELMNELQLEIETAKIELENFETELLQLKEIDLNRLPPKPILISSSGKTKYRPQVRSYTGAEILRMEFETLELDGELGRFLGKLQRERCAIALTGDSGAGKSTFSYQIAKAFLQKSLSLAYFALETGFTETMQQIISSHKINNYKFEAFDEGSLEEVRLAAPHFDCIVVDSYSKISAKPEDFENLRQEFPNTFFIFIFQKTTDGKIRGGSSIVFNSTATIDIRVTKSGHRIAFMQKSRYETENFVYSINQDCLLKVDKTPINWAGIEERWN